MQGDEFENRLRQDLPRGHVAQAKLTGRERVRTLLDLDASLLCCDGRKRGQRGFRYNLTQVF